MKQPYTDVQKEKKRAEMQKYFEDKAGVFAGKDDVKTFRDLSAALGFLQSRGGGTGDGNGRMLIELIAGAYRRDPDGVLATLKKWQDAVVNV